MPYEVVDYLKKNYGSKGLGSLVRKCVMWKNLEEIVKHIQGCVVKISFFRGKITTCRWHQKSVSQRMLWACKMGVE